MKAGKVLDVLQISRTTLKTYRERGYLKYTKLPTGQFDYDADSVYMFKNKKQPRQTLLYARVSTYNQKKDLQNQIDNLKQFALAKGYTVNGVYSDIASGISFQKRKSFLKMLPLILDGKVKRVVITHKDRLSRVGFDLFKYLFGYYDTDIVVVRDQLDPKTDEQELFSEIIALLHCFSMKMYSNRRKDKTKIQELLK